MQTLQETKDFLKKNYEKGCTCPACGQFVKLYKRKLNSGMAIVLILLYRNTFDWCNVKEYLRLTKNHNNHDWTLLAHWELLEERKAKHPTGGKTSGEWRVTETGKLFVKGLINMPPYIFIYNNKFQGTVKGLINIREALGSKFDYNELMTQ